MNIVDLIYDHEYFVNNILDQGTLDWSEGFNLYKEYHFSNCTAPNEYFETFEVGVLRDEENPKICNLQKYFDFPYRGYMEELT